MGLMCTCTASKYDIQWENNEGCLVLVRDRALNHVSLLTSRTKFNFQGWRILFVRLNCHFLVFLADSRNPLLLSEQRKSNSYYYVFFIISKRSILMAKTSIASIFLGSMPSWDKRKWVRLGKLSSGNHVRCWKEGGFSFSKTKGFRVG